MRHPEIFGEDGRGGFLEWSKLAVMDPPLNTLVAPGEGGVRKAGWAGGAGETGGARRVDLDPLLIPKIDSGFSAIWFKVTSTGCENVKIG